MARPTKIGIYKVKATVTAASTMDASIQKR